MSLPAPVASSIAPVRRSRLLLAGVVAYFALAFAASCSGHAGLGALAVFVLASTLLAPALRRHSVPAWGAWIALASLLALLAERGEGGLALDALPILVNAALCVLFAGTLRRGREPLIARFIAILEGRERLALPRVAAYARGLTWAWALLLGAQACVLAAILCVVPGGVFTAFGASTPVVFAAPAWRIYLHAGGYALVPLVFVLEYAYRRVHLRDVPHAPLPLFVARVVRRWPALLASLAADAGGASAPGAR